MSLLTLTLYWICHTGRPDSIDRGVESLRQCLLNDRRHETLALDLLRTTNMQFDSVLMELNDAIGQRFDVDIRGDASTWEVVVEGLGDLVVMQASKEVLNFEKAKLAKHLVIPLPSSWGYDDSDEADTPPPNLQMLDQGSDEYIQAANCFLEKGFSAQIVSIQRVQNAPLYRLYHQKKNEIAKRNGDDANEVLLKHGTRGHDPEGVWGSGPHTNTYGFDLRHSSDGNYYGRGAYFTDDASYTNSYAFTHQNGDKQVFLAYVARGKVEQKQTWDNVTRLIKHPSPGYQSICGPITGSHHGLIVYELNQSYPAYLVSYRV